MESILGSYRELGGINHIEGANLPSRQSIERIIANLESLIFPGFQAEETLALDGMRYTIGERVVSVSRALVPEVEKSIQYACRVRKDCQRHEDCRGEAEEIVRALLEGIPEIRRKVNRDVMAAFRGDPAARSQEEVILSYPGVEAILIHRIAHELWIRDVAMIPRMMSEHIHGVTGIDIHPGAAGRGFILHRSWNRGRHRGDGGHWKQCQAVPGRHAGGAQRAERACQQETAPHNRGRGDHLRGGHDPRRKNGRRPRFHHRRQCLAHRQRSPEQQDLSQSQPGPTGAGR